MGAQANHAETSERRTGRVKSWYSRNGINAGEWAKVRRKVLERDGWKCTACGKHGRLEIDHLTPLIHGGGKMDMENLAAKCRPCHFAKTKADTEPLQVVKVEVQKWRQYIEKRQNGTI